ncbi:MAG: response regulator transcription factor [Betaproteobacteria bacterium]|nr:response regulator transcription factor [Betaproteobacteria bacterium]
MSLQTQPVRVFVADDEPPARARLKELLEDLRNDCPCEIVGEAENGLQVLDRLPASGADVLLLDIQMPGLTGLEVARHLAPLETGPGIIFVTAHDAHAIEAFELNALDYLLKPVRATRLAAALRKVQHAGPPPREALARAHAEPRSHFSIAERNRILLVPLAGIVYFKAELKYVTLRTIEREHIIEESLVALEKEFSATLIRVHRNCLVARAAIIGFERTAGRGEEESHWEVLLQGVAERLPVSRRQWSAVRDILGEK